MILFKIFYLKKGLFNLRGGDIPFNPVFLSFAIVSLDHVKLVDFIFLVHLVYFILFRLFVDLNKLSNSLKKDLENENVNLYSYDSFYEQLKKYVQSQQQSDKFCVILFRNHNNFILIYFI